MGSEEGSCIFTFYSLAPKGKNDDGDPLEEIFLVIIVVVLDISGVLHRALFLVENYADFS